MQLKLRRSQKAGGIVSTTAIFCLDARVDFTPVEAQNIRRYKLHKEIIYNSEAAKRLFEKSEAQNDGSIAGSLKSLASAAMGALKLNISIESLSRGHHIECKSLEELLGAEEAIMAACQNLRGFLDVASTFDGHEVLIDFAEGSQEPLVVASSPAPALIAPASQSLSTAPLSVAAAAASPTLAHQPISSSDRATTTEAIAPPTAQRLPRPLGDVPDRADRSAMTAITILVGVIALSLLILIVNLG